MRTLITEPYTTQNARWPQAGRQIMAQFDAEAIVVYQAYRPAIGCYAAINRRFGGEFSLNRMSWIKPNFLWMMYRSGWGTKPGQEITLAIWLRRDAFDTILGAAVPSQFDLERYTDTEAWRRAVADSEVRQQWDPDHDPAGAPLARRAIQLGLRGETLARYATDWLLDIQDVSVFVAEQRLLVQAKDYQRLITPREEVYLHGGPDLDVLGN